MRTSWRRRRPYSRQDFRSQSLQSHLSPWMLWRSVVKWSLSNGSVLLHTRQRHVVGFANRLHPQEGERRREKDSIRRVTSLPHRHWQRTSRGRQGMFSRTVSHPNSLPTTDASQSATSLFFRRCLIFDLQGG